MKKEIKSKSTNNIEKIDRLKYCQYADTNELFNDLKKFLNKWEFDLTYIDDYLFQIKNSNNKPIAEVSVISTEEYYKDGSIKYFLRYNYLYPYLSFNNYYKKKNMSSTKMFADNFHREYEKLFNRCNTYNVKESKIKLLKDFSIAITDDIRHNIYTINNEYELERYCKKLIQQKLGCE